MMKIPAGSTGRMDKPRKSAPAAEKKGERAPAAPREKRERVRTKKFTT
jgi:hypothetical protein